MPGQAKGSSSFHGHVLVLLVWDSEANDDQGHMETGLHGITVSQEIEHV